MTGMLASVRNLDEARAVAAAGADIIDLKAPESGALGALDTDTVRSIVDALPGQTVSATVGDLPMDADILRPAVMQMRETGVDYIKIGLFPGGDWEHSLTSLKSLTADGYRLIAVFFGDCNPQLDWLGVLASAGFVGVMLDTMDKSSGPLTTSYPLPRMQTFVNEARKYDFLCGLAGSLRLEDVRNLLPLGPDYLGFRGALCRRHRRTDHLDPSAVRQIREQIRLNLPAHGQCLAK